jgi:hypothetical protein
MTQVTAIDAMWLGVTILTRSPWGKLTMIVAEFGAVFYSVKFKDFDDRGMRRQADREFSRKAELESQIAKQREEYVTDDLTKRLFYSRLLQSCTARGREIPRSQGFEWKQLKNHCAWNAQTSWRCRQSCWSDT